jgi:CheY-like chemotaxis protein
MSRILIVDDHPITREPLARLLRHEGYDAVCAANGLEAIDSVRSRVPDLILLDLMMPKMSGLAFLEALRANFSAPTATDNLAGRSDGGQLPVIVLTALANPNEVSRVRELGVRHIIVKSRFELEDLLGRVRSLLPTPAMGSAQSPC